MNQPNSQLIKELRFSRIEIEKRAEDTQQSRTIVGYAAKYDRWSDPIYDYFIEKIARGAFDDCDFSNCIATFNHNVNSIMARTSSGTLKLEVDAIGLRFSFDAPNTTTGNDMLEMVRRGDVSQCSFIFYVAQEKWTSKPVGQLQERELLKIAEVRDISLVTYPAYPDTEVSAARAAAEKRCALAIAPPPSDADFLELTAARYKYNS